MIGYVCIDMYAILVANSWGRTKGERRGERVLGDDGDMGIINTVIAEQLRA